MNTKILDLWFEGVELKDIAKQLNISMDRVVKAFSGLGKL
jgi:DNA-binding NarL/FixJ family response regulator